MSGVRPSRPDRWLGLVALIALVAPARPAPAQQDGAAGTRNRPFATEQATPPTEEAPGERDIEVGEAAGEGVLPTVPRPSAGELEALGATQGLVVHTLALSGNTVFSDAELTRAAAPYLGRPLESADLERLRRALTAVYVSSGYVSSGAHLPEQTVTDGRLRVEIVEGRLAEIQINGARRYRTSVLRRRLERAQGPPVRVGELENALRVLAQDPRIARLDARLEPGAIRGQSILRVAIEEADPGSLAFSFDNYQSPSVGSFAGYVDAGHRNPLGLGDLVLAGITVSEGLYRIDGSYTLPVHPSGTELTAEVRYSRADILDPPLDELDIRNEALSYAFGVRQTLWRTPRDWLETGLAFDLRRSAGTIFGDEPIDLSEGTDSGRSELRVLRADGAWTRRMRASALTLRSIASFGLDALGATMHHGNTPVGEVPTHDLPEGTFTSWVGQARYFLRFDRTGIEVDLRGDLQLADRPLLPLEQFVIGGPGSVRGYRTNQLAGDEGFSSGLEVRLPLVRTATGRTTLALAPFAEVGRVWWKGKRAGPGRSPGDPVTTDSGGKRTLSALGLGLEWEPHHRVTLRFDWGGALRDSGAGNDLQDQGITFRATWRAR